VRAEVPLAEIATRLSNETSLELAVPSVSAAGNGLERLADVPIYASDAIVRRSPPLQATADARPPRARVSPATAQALGLADGASVRVRQGDATALLDLQIDDRLADGVVRVAAAHASTATLGAMFGAIQVEPA
jgi:NADH-quinone oxidoreductase subunit G